MGEHHAKGCGLSADTSRALRVTCLGFSELCDFLFPKGMSFSLLGIFTTNSLEHKFGQFRQGCGGAYLVTVRGIFEKHRLQIANLIARLNPAYFKELPAPAKTVDCSCNFCSLNLVDENMLSTLHVLMRKSLVRLNRYLYMLAATLTLSVQARIRTMMK